jgi:ABC-type transport system involved in cytochrome c biogenesis permease subunit
MNILPFLLYIAAGAAYAIYFARRSPRVGRFATASLAAAALIHTFVVGMRTVELGQLPFVGTAAAISAFVWLLAVAYLYTEVTTDERAMGVFIVPLLVVLQGVSAVSDRVSEPSPVLDSPWLAMHVSSLLFAYAAFALACVIGITYVLLFRELKAKQLGFFAERLPSLKVLDAMNGRAVGVGWLFLTAGLAVGAVWLFQLQAETVDPRVLAMSFFDPKISVVLLTWLVYSFELYARRSIGWSGKRAAWLSTIGFSIILLNLVPVGYFLTDSHNF